MAVVLHHSRAKGTAKLVLLGIANHEGDGGAYPSVRTLARYANVNARNVQRAITWLIEHGEVVVDLQTGGERDWADHLRPNRYQVKVRCPSWCDRTTHHRDTRGKPERLLGEDVDPVAYAPPLPGGATAAPSPGATAALTVHTTSPPTPPPSDPTPCRDCGQGQARCQVVQAHWPTEDRHPYRPLAVLHATAGSPPEPQRRRRTSG